MPNAYGYFCRDGHNVCAINADSANQSLPRTTV